MQNPDVARILEEIADLLEIDGANQFRVRAYRTAARTLRDLPVPVADLVRTGRDLTEYRGIGADLAGKIATIVATGSLPLHRQLTRRIPAGLLGLLRIPGIGPKRVRMLHDQLGIRTPAGLRRALDAGRLTGVKGFGPRMVSVIHAGLGRAAKAERRMLLPEAEANAVPLERYLAGAPGVSQATVAGSYRRRKETVGDLDVLVTARHPADALARFAAYPEIAKVLARGPTRATVRLAGGVQVDLRAVSPQSYGAALVYFTGSKAHNLELRAIAQSRGLKLNEYGLFRGSRRVAGATEAQVYRALGLDWIPPELREARGEIALAAAHRLPALVTLTDVRGDLQMHTTASDGQTGLTELARAAEARGYEYIAVTDHSRRVTMAHGLDARRLRAQWRAVDAWNRGHHGLTILKSVEVDILEGGGLDLPDDVLAEADYVVAALHYGTRQTEREITRRLVGAARHPWVDAIGHPTGRLLETRAPYPLDFDALARAAADAGCLLEINGQPERMDLPDTLAAAARARGVRFVLSTDSHHPVHLAFMRYAVDIARRAGLERSDIANTLPLTRFREALKRHTGRSRMRRAG